MGAAAFVAAGMAVAGIGVDVATGDWPQAALTNMKIVTGARVWKERRRIIAPCLYWIERDIAEFVVQQSPRVISDILVISGS